MGLEATIICLDNSEWMRNGDYFPSRMEAQIDALTVLMNWKFQEHAESTVGILKMAKGPEVLVTPVMNQEIGKCLSALHSVKIMGKIDLMASIQVAQLALKHRQNKNQHQRMILFVGSPVQAETGALAKLGQALKKNNVALDIISFGEVEENREKLEALVKAVDNNGNSHFVAVEPVGRTLTEAIRASPLSGRPSSAGGEGGGGGEGGEDFFGIDPNEDPELAMAIRASLEEERRRREREQGEQKGAGASTTADTMVEVSEMIDDEEQAMLNEAIALSMQASGNAQSAPTTIPIEGAPQSEKQQESTTTSTPALESGPEITDPQFLNEILQSLPGVDPNDPQIQEIVRSMKAQQEKKEGDK